MTTLTRLSDLDLAALLCSRVCHDVISPVGAIANGLELMDDDDTDAEMKKTALDMVRSSAKTATAKVAMFTAYTQFTTASSATKDMRGVQSSLYRGKFYRPAVESRRLCIVQRESEGHYDVVNPTGSYRGAYQVSSTLARGATWMMLKEHKALMGTANATRVLSQLRKTPINNWPRYWQDALFSTVANWDHTGSGIHHWAGGRWHC